VQAAPGQSTLCTIALLRIGVCERTGPQSTRHCSGCPIVIDAIRCYIPGARGEGTFFRTRAHAAGDWDRGSRLGSVWAGLVGWSSCLRSNYGARPPAKISRQCVLASGIWTCARRRAVSGEMCDIQLSKNIAIQLYTTTTTLIDFY